MGPKIAKIELRNLRTVSKVKPKKFDFHFRYSTQRCNLQVMWQQCQNRRIRFRNFRNSLELLQLLGRGPVHALLHEREARHVAHLLEDRQNVGSKWYEHR